MTLDKIFRDGELITTIVNTNGGKKIDYAVKVSSLNRAKVTVYFSRDNWEFFGDEKIVPIVVEQANRVYFAKESQVNASDAVRNPGYKLNFPSGDTDVKRIQLNRSYKTSFDKFEGEYKTLHYDADCKMKYIEKPKIY